MKKNYSGLLKISSLIAIVAAISFSLYRLGLVSFEDNNTTGSPGSSPAAGAADSKQGTSSVTISKKKETDKNDILPAGDDKQSKGGVEDEVENHPALYSLYSPESVVDSSLSIDKTGGWLIDLDLNVLRNMDKEKTPVMELPLPDDTRLTGRVAMVYHAETGRVNVGGPLIGETQGSFYFTTGNGKVRGSIILPEGEQAYTITMLDSGGIVLKKKKLSEVMCIDYNPVQGVVESSQAATSAESAGPFDAPSAVRSIFASPASAPAVPAYSSMPGATKVLYLDFDGETVSGTAWNTTIPAAWWDLFGEGEEVAIVAKPFDTDGNPSSFSSTELDQIEEIYDRVREDFLPFKVNVTTSAAVYNAAPRGRRIRCIITDSNDWDPDKKRAGVAFVGSFNWEDDNPAWVYPKRAKEKVNENLFIYNSENIALVTAHEIGHTLGLEHHGVWVDPSNNPACPPLSLSTTGSLHLNVCPTCESPFASTPTHEEYYDGHGTWGPIMGGPYYKELTQWSEGNFYGASNSCQRDLDTMISESGLTYRRDDHGDERYAATRLTAATGSIAGTGIIEQNTDVDVFKFEVRPGTIRIAINNHARGPNLDIRAELYSESGVKLESENPSDSSDARVNYEGAAWEDLYLYISGTGRGTSAGRLYADPDYSDYGSLGEYSIEFTNITALSRPTNPSPSDDAKNRSIIPTLSWSSSPGADNYDIYIGEHFSSLSKLANQPGTTYNPGPLKHNTTYFWRIDPRNAGGAIQGYIWSFTTKVPLPQKPIKPRPSSGSVYVSRTPTLNWENGGDATQYHIYFAGPGGIDDFIITDPSEVGVVTLDFGTTYIWRVDAINASGTTTGDPWSFSTLPPPPQKTIDPFPANGADDVLLPVDFSWKNGDGLTYPHVNYPAFRLYIGTNPNLGSDNYESNPSIIRLNDSTTYYWRVDASNLAGSTQGNVWHFTTAPRKPVTAHDPTPADGAVNISINPSLNWAGSTATHFKVFFGEGSARGNPSVETTSKPYQPGTLKYDTTYYWTVDQWNVSGTVKNYNGWRFTTAKPPFVAHPQPVGAYFSSAAFGDDDHDGDLDVVMSGRFSEDHILIFRSGMVKDRFRWAAAWAVWKKAAWTGEIITTTVSWMP